MSKCMPLPTDLAVWDAFCGNLASLGILFGLIWCTGWMKAWFGCVCVYMVIIRNGCISCIQW